jgi:hypothetical protein
MVISRYLNYGASSYTGTSVASSASSFVLVRGTLRDLLRRPPWRLLYVLVFLSDFMCQNLPVNRQTHQMGSWRENVRPRSSSQHAGGRRPMTSARRRETRMSPERGYWQQRPRRSSSLSLIDHSHSLLSMDSCMDGGLIDVATTERDNVSCQSVGLSGASELLAQDVVQYISNCTNTAGRWSCCWSCRKLGSLLTGYIVLVALL